MPRFLLLLFCCTLFFVKSSDLFAQSPAPIGYDFERPELVAKLPERLKEISGLGISPRSGELIAVQDEEGYFFRLDLQSGQLLGATEFWKDGDYEGIEAVGDDIWVVKSSGTLYRIRRPGSIEQEVTKFNGFLVPENDVEGLAYDKSGNRLLLSCKSYVAETMETRSVFAFDLATEEFITRPVFNVGRQAISNYLDNCPQTRRHDKIIAFINEKDNFKLGPSAIAIHPTTGQIFIASSPGKLVIILDRAGNIQHVRRLDKDIFPQPEGMTFTEDGTLYVSTEASDDEPARLYRLRYQPEFTGFSN